MMTLKRKSLGDAQAVTFLADKKDTHLVIHLRSAVFLTSVAVFDVAEDRVERYDS